jgi:NAD(P)-dependent dehydrogenase (short-subunit alcohol dehydrogenase family)
MDWTMNDLEGTTVLVTGGSRGIGRQIVLGALERGAQVVFCARELGQDVEEMKERAGSFEGERRVAAVRADISQERDVEGLFDTALNAFGRIDVVINNAGVSRAQMLVWLETPSWNEVIATNLTGAFLVSRQAVKQFLSQGRDGKIISVGSVMQFGAESNASYAASKGGLIGLTHTIAQEYGPSGITANLVVAGYADVGLMQDVNASFTRLVVEACPQKRLASASEIASVILFLASRRGRLIKNGEAVFASGGLIDPPVA